MWFDVFLFVSVAAAAFVQATTGFGFAIITMALWPLLMSVPDATQLLMFGSMVTVSYIAVMYRRHINFKIVTVPLVLALAGLYLGLSFLLSVDNDIAVRVIGGLLILLAVYFFVFSDRIRIPENIWSASLAGISCGLMSGFFNIAGPPIVLYYSAAAKDKKEYTGTVQFLFAVMILFKMIYLYVKRGLPEMVLTHTPIVIVGSIAGMLLGLRLFDRLSTRIIKRMVYILMIAAGGWYIIHPR